MSVKLTGADEFLVKLKRVDAEAESIQRAAVRAGCAVMAAACKQAAPGTIKQEVGFTLKTEGGKTVGRAGFMRFPRRGQRRGPHGVFVDQGTRFITPRRFIADALRSSRSRAVVAMRRAGKGRIRSLVRK